MTNPKLTRRGLSLSAMAAVLAATASRAEAENSDRWNNTRRSPDARAEALVDAMTLDEKILLVQSHIFLPPEMASMLPNPSQLQPPADALKTSGYTPPIPRLNIPALNESDASAGIAQGMSPPPGGRQATAFPATILTASTWEPSLAQECGAAIGQEARASGIAIMLAGGCNLTRDPRCGRTFEYYGEDPLLSGLMAGAAVQGIQSKSVISTVKHFALNAQEVGRNFVDETIEQGALRESDLLAFQIAIERGAPGAVMSAYNKLNGAYCSEDHWLLSEVLKRDWNYPGYVMSDWGGVHSTREAALAGLDQQSGQEVDAAPFFGEPLKALAQTDREVAALLDDKVRRILRSVIAIGVFDNPPAASGAIDLNAHADIAQRTAEEGIVLLKNADAILPLSTSVRRIALIGMHADIGVLSGGGSAQVTPPGSLTTPDPLSPIPGAGAVDHPSSPLRAIQAQAPNARVDFNDGANHATAAALAARADVAIVIVRRWDSEGRDARDLSLPDNQDALVAAVARANPRTIVVATAGGPIAAPWLDSVSAFLMAWYPGIRGAEALARILFGAVNPSGRLAVTFPHAIEDLPRPQIDGIDLNLPMGGFGLSTPPDLTAHMNEGADVGYRWHEKRGRGVLFPFGFGLSYTQFSIAQLEVDAGRTVSISCTVTNTGAIAGKQVVQIYARPPQTGAARRLIGFKKVALASGASERITINAELRLLSRFDVEDNAWRLDAGAYEFSAGASSVDLAAAMSVTLRARRLRA